MRYGLFLRLASVRDQSLLKSLLKSLAQSLEILGYGRNFNVLPLESRALNDFNSIFGNLLSHIDSKGDTHQVGVLELPPWPFVPIVQQHVEPGPLQLPCDGLGGAANRLVLGVRRHHHHLKRRDRRRQPESVLVVRLLDSGGQDALDSNPIAPHDWRHLLAITEYF